MSTNEVALWYERMPKITRYWFTGSVVIPLLARFGILKAQHLVLLFDLFIYKFQIWRPFTALLYYPITPQSGFTYLINLYFLYSYSQKLETSTFDGKTADYLFMLIFNWICILIIAFFTDMLYILMDPMILSMYIWCQLNRDVVVSFWFGTKFQAMYLPWVLVAFNMIIRGGGLGELIGIAVGHLYFFLMFKYPQEANGTRLISTPSILYKYFPNRVGGVSGIFGRAPTTTSTQRNDNSFRRRNIGGAGYVLGDS